VVEKTASADPAIWRSYFKQYLASWWRRWGWLAVVIAIVIFAFPVMRWLAYAAFVQSVEMFQTGAHKHGLGKQLFDTMPFWMDVKEYIKQAWVDRAFREGALLTASLCALGHAGSLPKEPPVGVSADIYANARLWWIRLIMAGWLGLVGAVAVIVFDAAGYAQLWHGEDRWGLFLPGYLLWASVIALWGECLVTAVLYYRRSWVLLIISAVAYMFSYYLRFTARPDEFGDTIMMDTLLVVPYLILLIWGLSRLWGLNAKLTGEDRPIGEG